VFFAESLWQSREIDLLVWVTATSRASVLSAFAAAATAVMDTDPTGDAELVAARFVSWLRETRRSWLVVLDDLSDAEVLGLWPEGPAGAVLVTTRSSATFSSQRRARVLPVGPFSTREALNYVTGCLTSDPDQRLGAMALVEEIGGEPLALAQAAAVIASSPLTCGEYRDHFVRRRQQLMPADGELSAAAVTWTLSLERADRLSPDRATRLVLALAALFDSHGTPGAVFTTRAACEYLAGGRAVGPADRERAWAALLLLERTGLLAVDPAGANPVVWMSPVVQAAVRAALPAGMLDRAARAAADALLQAWPEDEPRAWSAAALRPSVASLLQASGDLLWKGGCHRLLLQAGQSMDNARLAGPAAKYWKELATVSGRVLGPDHPHTVSVGERLARASLAAGQAAEAIPWFQWVLADRIRTMGPDHPATIAARRNLGHALVAANQFGKALTVLQETVSAYESVCGVDHLDTIGARDELAAAHRAAGDLGNAIRLYRRSLNDRERIQGSRHRHTMSTRLNLADVYLADGRYREARSQYKRTLADRERLLGPDHLDTITARGRLGSAYHAAGQMASAVQYYEQTRADYERVLGTDHPDTLAYRVNLANAYYEVGRLTDATTLLRDTAARCERVLPAGDPLTRTARTSLTNIAGR
jgi:tetratricopeptide (TPR) repeat protein